MRFDPPLVTGRFVRRYKRFLVDVELDSGETIVAHTTNTGGLKGCQVPGARVALRHSSDPKRKLAHTWVMIRIGRHWVGVDTGLAVPLVAESITRSRLLPELRGYPRLTTEVAYGTEGRSRIDLLLSRGGQAPPKIKTGREPWTGDERVYIEVKNTTLRIDEGDTRVGAFPDAVTERGQKHLRELMDVVQGGQRAAMVWVAQRGDVDVFRPADAIDPEYGRLVREAARAGVELYAITGSVSPTGIKMSRRLSIEL